MSAGWLRYVIGSGLQLLIIPFAVEEYGRHRRGSACKRIQTVELAVHLETSVGIRNCPQSHYLHAHRRSHLNPMCTCHRRTCAIDQ